MRLVDANLLIYARVARFQQHEASKAWLDARLNAPEPLGLPWPSLLGFARLTTNARIFERPLTIGEAWKQVEAWLACPPVWVPLPTERHQAVLAQVLATPGLRANHVPDAHLAALAIEHGLVLCSTDADFNRFDDLRWDDPVRPG